MTDRSRPGGRAFAGRPARSRRGAALGAGLGCALAALTPAPGFAQDPLASQQGAPDPAQDSAVPPPEDDAPRAAAPPVRPGVRPDASPDEIFRQVFGGEAPELPEIAYPLLISGLNRGDVLVRPGRGEQAALIDRDALIEALGPFLIDEKAAELVGLPADGRWLTDVQVSGIGLPARFNNVALALEVDVPLEFRTVVPLALSRRYDPSGLLDLLEPEPFSAYLNSFVSLSALEASDLSPTGFDRGDLTLDGAVNLRGYVLEGAGTYSTEFQGEADWRRGDVRLTKDFRERMIRFEAGDLTAPIAGLQGRPRIAGVSAFREFGFRPYERFSPQPEQEFQLDRPARAAIFINGRYVQELRLIPGRYRLTDLPLRSGAGNDIQIELRYDDGQVEVITFPAFFDLRLLRPGVSEFGVHAGVTYEIEEGERFYEEDNPAFSGYYRRGLSETFTAGVNAQIDSDVAVLGGEVLTATAWGTFGLLAASNVAESDGHALTGIYRWTGTDFRRQATADLQVSYAGDGYRTLRVDTASASEYGVRGRIAFNLTETRRFQATADYQRRRETRSDDYAVEALVNQRARFGTLAVAARWETIGGEDEASVRVSFTRALGRGTVSANYDTANDSFRGVYNRPISPGIGKLGYSAGYSALEDIHEVTGTASYRGNRVEGTFEQRIGQSGPDSDFGSEIRSTVFAGSALAMAGGKFALSRPVYDSFAIVQAQGAAAQFDIGVDPQSRFASTQRDYNARSGALGPAVVPDLSPFLVRTLEVEPIDAPAGISIGGEAYSVSPPYRSGYRIEVGGAGNVALVGVLAEPGGEPIAFAAGVARFSDGDQVVERPVFTNAGGRFYVDGVVAGEVVSFEFGGVNGPRANVRAPDGAIGLQRYQEPVIAVPASGFDGRVQTPVHTSDFTPGAPNGSEAGQQEDTP